MKSSVRDGPAGVAAVAEQDLPVGASIVNSLMSWNKEKEWWDRSLKGWSDLQGNLLSLGQSNPCNKEGIRKRKEYGRVSYTAYSSSSSNKRYQIVNSYSSSITFDRRL